MRGTIVRLSEVVAAGTLSARDFLARSGRSCHVCGLTPAQVEHPRRPNPSTALLEPSTSHPSDPLRRSRYRCRNREACARRASLLK